MTARRIGRRAALMGGASIAALSATAAGAGAAITHDPHPAWVEQRETTYIEDCHLRAVWENRYGPDFDWSSSRMAAWVKYEKPRLKEQDRLWGMVIDTPAYTPEGMAAKAWLLWMEGAIGWTGYGDQTALGLIADLQRMAFRPLSAFEANGYAVARANYGDETPIDAI